MAPTTPTLSRSSLAALLLAGGVLVRLLLRARSALARQRIIAPAAERVLILGASSGTGAAIAREYARRGCGALVLVARRAEQLEAIKRECVALLPSSSPATRILCAPADCTRDTDVANLRKLVIEQLGGIDTVHITLGVSALLPLLGIAGVDPVRPSPSTSSPNPAADGSSSSGSSSGAKKVAPTHASSFALSSTYTAVSRACTANLTSTALLLTAFAPVLQLSSRAPAIHILSSLAALFPAPTRALYGATKAAQLILAQGFELETESQVGYAGELVPNSGTEGARRKITFVYLCPGTILSDFRRSAVDIPSAGGDAAGAIVDDSIGSSSSTQDEAIRRAGVFDSTWDTGRKKKSDGLTPESVARRAIALVDRQHGGVHTMKLFELVGRIALVVAPWIPARVAHKKYGY